ncbi:15346_t:CDS:1, partial [Cetraspora pellucida]
KISDLLELIDYIDSRLYLFTQMTDSELREKIKKIRTKFLDDINQNYDYVTNNQKCVLSGLLLQTLNLILEKNTFDSLKHELELLHKALQKVLSQRISLRHSSI